MPANERFVELYFPVGGVDTSQEYQGQGPQTAFDAVNVRATDPATLRERGGSRCGIARYIDQQLAGEIQHLNVIVDPQADRLRQNFIVPGDDWVEDPLVPGYFVPPGGWGNPSNPNADQPAGGGGADNDIAYEQQVLTGYDQVSTEQTSNYPTTPNTGAVSIVAVVTNDSSTGCTVTVTNGALSAYTQVGAYQRFTKLGNQFSLSVWRRKASEGASETAVKVTPSALVDMVVVALEYSGPNATTQVQSTDTGSGNAAAMSAGTVTVDATGNAVLGIFAAALSPDTVTPSAGYTLRADHPDGTVDNTDIQLYVTEKLNCTAAAAENPQATFAGGADDYVARSVELKD